MGTYDTIPTIDPTHVPDGARCQEASPFSAETYLACNAPAVAVVDNGDSRPYYMCVGCTDHNVTNRRARALVVKDGVSPELRQRWAERSARPDRRVWP